MAEGRIGELALKAPVPKQELETKGNKDDSEDGHQNHPCPLNVAPTKSEDRSTSMVDDFQLKVSGMVEE
jgi:hypothetical protein